MKDKRQFSLILEVLVACALLGIALPLFVRVPVERLRREAALLYKVELQREMGIRLAEIGVSLFKNELGLHDLLRERGVMKELHIPIVLTPQMKAPFVGYQNVKVSKISKDKAHVLVQATIQVPKGPGGQMMQLSCQYYVRKKKIVPGAKEGIVADGATVA